MATNKRATPPMRRRISVLLPIHNEVDNIVPLLDEIETALRPLGGEYEIIAVDDASRDGSWDVLKAELAKRPSLRLLLLRKNAGQTAALDAGFRNATGDVIVTLDADRQNDPKDIPVMLSKLDEGYDCVAGWRKKRQDGFILRRFPSLIANGLIRFLWRSRLKDLGCAIKVYRREITSDLRLYGDMHRFMGLILEGNGARVAQIEVNHRPRVAGHSKYTITRVFKVLVDLVTLWFLQRFTTKPMRVFGALGFLSWTGAGLFGAITVWQKLALDFSANRNPLFVLTVFLMGLGIQFFVLGLLAELVIRGWYEGAGRMQYSIRTTAGFPASPTNSSTKAA